jgi:uroporphyrinogen decarboxylase
MMNKRDLIFSLLDPARKPAGIPAAFFLHFDPAYHRAPAAVEKHLEYFRYTGMDFVKIQFEQKFPALPFQRPSDWSKMPFYGVDFYEEQLKVIDGLVKAAGKDAAVVLTLYSPFMIAGHSISADTLDDHIRQDPDAVAKGMQTITESLMGFVKAAIHLGLDGFYTSTQGGEAGRLPDRTYFDRCIRPYDLMLMEEINRTCPFNILHICDYHLPYDSLSPYLNYPGQVVNSSLELTGEHLTAQQVADQFKRPFMGGLERKGLLSTGTPEQVKAETLRVLHTAPERFILAADCTVPSETPWLNLRTAIETAHTFER